MASIPQRAPEAFSTDKPVESSNRNAPGCRHVADHENTSHGRHAYFFPAFQHEIQRRVALFD